MSLWQALGLAPSTNDEKLKALIAKSYSSVRVVGRGTVKIDPEEVRCSEEFKKAQKEAKTIIKAS